MLDAWTRCVFSRRGWLSCLAGAGTSAWNRAYARPTDFWNKKPPAEWSNDEIDRLITSSPWARQVTAEGGGGTPGTRSPRGSGVPSGPGGPGIGGDRGSERDPQEDSSQTSQDALDRLKSFTSLEPRGKRGAQPGVVQRPPGVGGGSILFGFSKEFLDLGPGDGEAVFSTTLGRLSIKTKFDLKTMLYHGKVAL